MATTSQTTQESQELTRLFNQTKKTLPILTNRDMTDENVQPVLKTFAGYESNHESSPFSISDAKDVTAILTSVTAVIQDPKIPRESQQTSNIVTKIHDGMQR